MFENLAVLFRLKGATIHSDGIENEAYAPATRHYYFRYGA